MPYQFDMDSFLKQYDFNQDGLIKLIDFLSQGLENPNQDIHANLVLLSGATEDKRIRAKLTVSPNLENLPQLYRDGINAPYIYGPALGLDQLMITDPELQRTECLYINLKTVRVRLNHLVTKIHQIFNNLNIITPVSLQ